MGPRPIPASSPYPKPFFAPVMTASFVVVLDVPVSANEPVGMLPVPRSPIEMLWAASGEAARRRVNTLVTMGRGVVIRYSKGGCCVSSVYEYVALRMIGQQGN